MGYVQRYKKEGCATAGDVNFSNIANIAKVKVPLLVISSFQKKVAAAEKNHRAFDVFVEEDVSAGKCRLVVKKIPPSDIIIDWVDTARVEARKEVKKRVLKVTEELHSWSATSTEFSKRMTAVKEKVKALKEDVKGIEGHLSDTAVESNIHEAREGLNEAKQEGEGIMRELDKWYEQTPRKGTAPLLKANNLNEQDLEKKEKDDFTAALFRISQEAGVAQRLYKTDIEAATQALIVRLNNLESQVSKTYSEAFADVRKNFAAEIERLREFVGSKLSAMKVEEVRVIVAQFKAREGEKYRRFAGEQKYITGMIEAYKGRLQNIPAFLADFQKQSSRVVKGVPLAFQSEPGIRKLLQELVALDGEHKKNMAEAHSVLTECNELLTQHMRTLS